MLSNSLRWDQEFFSFGMPAMARGAALLQGTREIFSEAFGAYGWNEGMRMVKWSRPSCSLMMRSPPR